MARRAKVIPMDAIRDDSSTSHYPRFFHDAEHYMGCGKTPCAH
jgi:hypothetical protein